MKPNNVSINVFWAVVVILAAGAWFFQALNGIPPAISDLAGRAAPAILVLFGIMLLLGRRISFGNVVSVLLTGAIVVGIVNVAFSQQSNVLRTDYAAPILYPVDNAVQSLSITIDVGITEITLTPAAQGDRVVRGEYIGSLESEIISAYTPNGANASVTISEQARNAIPSLELVGRGKLTLSIPAGVTIDQFVVTSKQGNFTFDASTLTLKSLQVTLGSGDLATTLGTTSGLIGDLKTGAGNLTVTIPPTIAAQIALKGGGAAGAQFNPALYTLSIERVLVPKNVSAPAIQLNVDAPGQIAIQ